MLTLKRLERSEAKVSRYVLMGRGCSNVVLLPTYRRKAQEFWASLRRKPIELLKNSLISRFLVLRFPEHMMQFNS